MSADAQVGGDAICTQDSGEPAALAGWSVPGYTTLKVLGSGGFGDVVLARVRGWLLVLHQILDREPGRFLIGTTAGRADGWVTADDVFGRVTRVERPGG